MRPSLIVQWPLCHGFTFHASSESPLERDEKPAFCNCSLLMTPAFLVSSAKAAEPKNVTARATAKANRRFNICFASDYFRHAGNCNRVAAVVVRSDRSG